MPKLPFDPLALLLSYYKANNLCSISHTGTNRIHLRPLAKQLLQSIINRVCCLSEVGYDISDVYIDLYIGLKFGPGLKYEGKRFNNLAAHPCKTSVVRITPYFGVLFRSKRSLPFAKRFY